MTYRPIMTESEAAKTWCPFVGLSADQRHYSLHGTPPAGPARSTCVGSRCMVWVWDDGLMQKVHGVSEVDKAQYTEADGWSWNNGGPTSYGWFERPLGENRPGHCGRVGSP